jgi:hypothetical protein
MSSNCCIVRNRKEGQQVKSCLENIGQISIKDLTRNIQKFSNAIKNEKNTWLRTPEAFLLC